MLHRLSCAPLRASLTLTLLTLGAAALAQNGYPGNGNGQRPGMPPGMQQQFQQMQMIRQLMATYQNTRAASDPTQSATTVLLKRDDVRSELYIDGRQRDQLDSAATKAQQDQATQQQQMFQQMRQQMRGGPGQANPRNMTPEERNARMATMQTQMKEMQQKQAQAEAARDKDAEAILRPGQVKRLHELDLQWRGAMALADTQVGEKLMLTPEQQAGINTILQEFRTQERQPMQGMFSNQSRRGRGRFGQGGASGANASPDTPPAAGDGTPPAPGNSQADGFPSPNDNGQNTPPQPPTMDQLKRRMDDQLAATTKARRAAEVKVLALLTPEQKQQWLLLQGKPFLFRAYL